MEHWITLKNIKHNAKSSHETQCFTAKVYFRKLSIGEVRNDGCGGSNLVTITHQKEWDMMLERIQELPVNNTDMEFNYPQDLESICEELITTYLALNKLKKLLREKVVYIPDGGSTIKTSKGAPSVYVKNEWVDQWRAANPNDIILNTMKLEEALVLYNKHC